MEIWKDIPGYEGYYQVSSLGGVKGLTRVVKKRDGTRTVKEKILNQSKDNNGYLKVSLCKNGKEKTFRIHQLVCMSFLNHNPYNKKSLVVNHKNFTRTDNRLENLEIITHRENTNQKHLPSSSKHTGVTWEKSRKKWLSQIVVCGKVKKIGRFNCEIEASEAYKEYLKSFYLCTLSQLFNSK